MVVDNLIGFFKSLSPVITKKDLLSRHKNITDGLHNDLIPLFEEFSRSSEKAISSNKILSELKIAGKFNGSGAKLLTKMISDLKLISSHQQDIDKAIHRLPDTMMNTGITFKSGVVIKIVEDTESLVLSGYDIAYLIFANDRISDSEFSSKKIKEMYGIIPGFINLLNKYSEIYKDIDKVIQTAPDQAVAPDTTPGFLETFLDSVGFKTNLPINNFTGNPIYHFRMALVDRAFRSNEVRKEKKRLLELKLLELRSRQGPKVDPNLEKQIQYFEGKIEDLEYKIRKFEEG